MWQTLHFVVMAELTDGWQYWICTIASKGTLAKEDLGKGIEFICGEDYAYPENYGGDYLDVCKYIMGWVGLYRQEKDIKEPWTIFVGLAEPDQGPSSSGFAATTVFEEPSVLW